MYRYPATYYDTQGFEETTILNDGETLRVCIRGVEFTSSDFDSLEPADDATPGQLSSFFLHQGELCSCRIKCELPIPVYDKGQLSTGELTVDLQLGDPAPNGGLDLEKLSIEFRYKSLQFVGLGKSGRFEDELIEIQKQLPSGIYMRACINCLYSDYSPYGHGRFGYLMCFRNLKQEYLAVTSKDEFWSVHDRYDRLVQETYVCPDFQRRISGTGYRG